jgi:hypothetical protein
VVDLRDVVVDADRTQAEALLEVDHVEVEGEGEGEGNLVGGDSPPTGALVTLPVLVVEVVASPLPRIRIHGFTLCPIFAKKISFQAVFSSFPRKDAKKTRTPSPTKTFAMRQRKA